MYGRINQAADAIDVEKLHAVTIDAQSIYVDFSADREGLGDDDMIVYWDTFQLDLDGRDVTVIDRHGEPWGIVHNGRTYDLYDLEALAQQEEDERTDDEPDLSLMDIEFIRNADPIAHGSEGPMMNFAWPLHSGGLWTGIEPEVAAAALADLPLCYVEINDEGHLVLTGGGMDLSWEIAAGYIACGFLPPAAIELPAMAETVTPTHGLIAAAVQRSCRLLIARMNRRIETIDQTLASMRERARGE